MGTALIVGHPVPWKAKGDFTIYRQIMRFDREELESRIGYHKGRLDRGAIIAVMSTEDLAGLKPSDFTLGASTRWSRSSAAAPWAPEFTKFTDSVSGAQQMEPNAIESKLALEGSDPQALKEKVIRFFQHGGDNRPAKVFPIMRNTAEMKYPDAIGGGVPQFMLHNEMHWTIVRILPEK